MLKSDEIGTATRRQKSASFWRPLCLWLTMICGLTYGLKFWYKCLCYAKTKQWCFCTLRWSVWAGNGPDSGTTNQKMQNTCGRGCETKLEEEEEMLQGKGFLKEEFNFELHDFAC